MMVIFVSQCEKKALPRTRRVCWMPLLIALVITLGKR